MELSNLNIKNGLCISLGANINGKFGTPIETLIKCRPILEKTLEDWIFEFKDPKSNHEFSNEIFSWSSLYDTHPYGVSQKQPNYINTLVIIKSVLLPNPSLEKAISLLKKLKKLEIYFGREKKEDRKRWLSRCLDLDILWWDDLNIKNTEITIPHPRFLNRNFVITPLSELLDKTQTVKKLKHNKWIL